MQCGTNKSAQASKLQRWSAKLCPWTFLLSLTRQHLCHLSCFASRRRDEETNVERVSYRGITELQLTGDKMEKLRFITSWCICAEDWGALEVNLGRCCLLTLQLPNAPCYSAQLDARPLLTWTYLSTCKSYPLHPDPLHTRFFENHVTSCSPTTSVQRNKIKCFCTWKGTNGLKENRRDQMFVSKHTTLWLSLFLLLCPDSFFILFKQLYGKENWLKSNLCFMISSSAERRPV